MRQVVLQNFGTTLPDGYVVPTKRPPPVVTNKGIKKVGTTKTMGKIERGVVPKAVSTTPPQEPVSTTPSEPVSTTDAMITLPADLLARIENIKDVKSGKKTVSQWAISSLTYDASRQHHGVTKDGRKY